MSELMRMGEPVSDFSRWVQVLAPAAQLAQRIADTEFVPSAMRGKPDVVTAAIMYGDELGIGPMQALAGIHVVEGRPQPSAELMRGLIRRAGHRITVHHLSGEMVRISGLRFGEPESERVAITWTIDMARSAGLLNRQNWQRYPRAMLLARASRDLAVLLFPDVIKGLTGGDVDYSPDDVAAWAQSIPEPEAAPIAPDSPDMPALARAVRRTGKSRVRNVRLPEPGYHVATEDSPGPDGSVDVPLPESVPDGEPEPDAVIEPGGGSAGAGNEPTAPLPSSAQPAARESVGEADPGPPHLGLMGDRQRRAVFAAFERIGISGADSDRPRRLRLASVMLGKPVESFANVTRQDGFTLTRLATDIEVGALTWDESAGTLVRADEPPPEGDEYAPPAD